MSNPRRPAAASEEKITHVGGKIGDTPDQRAREKNDQEMRARAALKKAAAERAAGIEDGSIKNTR